MNWLSTSTLLRLRDQLRTRGQRPSIVLSTPGNVSAEAAELAQTIADYGALCEAMYLMMSADGQVSNDEREVLKGALRNLSFDEIRGIYIEAMLDGAARRVAEQGREKRLVAVLEELREDPTRAEVAFVLAAAIAFADNVIADEENELLNLMAEGLEIDDARANALLDQAEAEMAADRASAAPHEHLSSSEEAASPLLKRIKAAIEDSKLTQREFEEILALVHADHKVDAQEKVLMEELLHLVDNKTIKLVSN